MYVCIYIHGFSPCNRVQFHRTAVYYHNSAIQDLEELSQSMHFIKPLLFLERDFCQISLDVAIRAKYAREAFHMRSVSSQKSKVVSTSQACY